MSNFHREWLRHREIEALEDIAAAQDAGLQLEMERLHLERLRLAATLPDGLAGVDRLEAEAAAGAGRRLRQAQIDEQRRREAAAATFWNGLGRLCFLAAGIVTAVAWRWPVGGLALGFKAIGVQGPDRHKAAVASYLGTVLVLLIIIVALAAIG